MNCFRILPHALLLLFIFSCESDIKDIDSMPPAQETDTPEQSSYKNAEFPESPVNMKIPQEWQVKGTVLYDQDNKKTGELAPGVIHPTSSLSGEEYLRRLENGGPDIQATPVSYSFGEDYDYIYGDTLELNNRTWYLGKTRSSFESEEGATGFWYPHHYVTTTGEKVFIITFYARNENLTDLYRQQILNILRSVTFNDETSE